MGELTHETPKCLLEVAGRPFVHHQLRQLFRQGVQRVVLCLGHLGEQVVAARRRRLRVRPGRGVFVRRSGVARYRRRDSPGLASARPGVLRALRRLLPRVRLRGRPAGIRGSGKLALMTVFRNEGQWDTSNVEFQGRPHPGLRQGHADPSDAVHRLRSGHPGPPGARGRCGKRPVRSGHGLSGNASPGRTRGVRGQQSDSTRSARWRGSKRRSAPPGGSRHELERSAVQQEDDMSHAAQFLSEAKQVIDGLNIEAIEQMAHAVGAGAKPRRPAVHSGCRRQRGQRVARRQRFSQDRRNRSLCSDGQRFGTDGADQRRGLADDLRGMAARSAG